MKAFKRLLSVVFALALVLALASVSFAAGSVTYKGDAEKFVFKPGSEYSPTDLFENFKGVMPGDTLTDKITVTNNASNKSDVKIYMRSHGAQLETDNFLNQMHLTVSTAVKTDLFDAQADETAGLTDWVCLGTLRSGGSVTLDLKLEVPITMGDEFQNAIGYIDWEFMVEEYKAEETGNKDNPSSPPTSDPMSLMLIGSAVAALVTFVVIKKKVRMN